MATGSQPEERTALRQYYDDHGLLLSTEWILKILAIVGCLVSGAWLLGGGGCSGAGAGAGAGAWARAGAGAVLVCAGGAALVLAAVAARLPPRAPLAWLVIDITTLTVMGALLLLTVAAAAALCDARAVSDYLLTSLGVASAAAALGGAAATYRAAARRLDRALPAREPAHPPPTEQEV